MGSQVLLEAEFNFELNRARMTWQEVKKWANTNTMDGRPSEQKPVIDIGKKGEEWRLRPGDLCIVVWMAGPVIRNDEAVIVTETPDAIADMYKIMAIDDGVEEFSHRLGLRLLCRSENLSTYKAGTVIVRKRQESINYYTPKWTERDAKVKLAIALERLGRLIGYK